MSYPYERKSYDHGYEYFFVTGQNQQYKVYFYNIFKWNGYEPIALNPEHVFMCGFTCATEQQDKIKFDNRTAPTITNIIKDFFANTHPECVAYYYCDNADKKENARKRLFDYWWVKDRIENGTGNIEKIEMIVEVPDENGEYQNLNHSFLLKDEHPNDMAVFDELENISNEITNGKADEPSY